MSWGSDSARDNAWREYCVSAPPYLSRCNLRSEPGSTSRKASCLSRRPSIQPTKRRKTDVDLVAPLRHPRRPCCSEKAAHAVVRIIYIMEHNEVDTRNNRSLTDGTASQTRRHFSAFS